MSCGLLATSASAWKRKPSWYAIASNDRIIAPDLQRALVPRLHATSMSLQSSHVALLSQPNAIAALILQAAQTVPVVAHDARE